MHTTDTDVDTRAENAAERAASVNGYPDDQYHAHRTGYESGWAAGYRAAVADAARVDTRPGGGPRPLWVLNEESEGRHFYTRMTAEDGTDGYWCEVCGTLREACVQQS